MIQTQDSQCLMLTFGICYVANLTILSLDLAILEVVWRQNF